MLKFARVLFLLLLCHCSTQQNHFSEYNIILNKLECQDNKKFMCLKLENTIKEIFINPHNTKNHHIQNYELNVKIKTNSSSFVMQSNDVTTRNKILARLEYELYNTQSKEIVCKGIVQNTGSLAVAESPYINLLSQESFTEKTIEESSYMLRSRILQCLYKASPII